mgnify:FL=1
MKWAAAFFLMLDAMPPRQFDYAPPFYSVERVAREDIGRVCGFPDPDLRLLGCTHGPTLRVFLRDDLSGTEYRAVLHHEWAHLNGWRHD